MAMAMARAAQEALSADADWTVGSKAAAQATDLQQSNKIIKSGDRWAESLLHELRSPPASPGKTARPVASVKGRVKVTERGRRLTG